MLNPKIHGRHAKNIIIPLIIDAFVLLMPNVSVRKATRFSNTAITVEKLANVINRKKSVPQIRPPVIFTKTFGSVTKIRAGPWSG